MKNNDILVSVFVVSYNHSEFIRDALDSVLMQKTSFRYEVVVHDDASTDGTQDIIREYYNKFPEIIVPVLRKTNVFSVSPSKISDGYFKVARGKYTAICEADDYWTDEYKLQKQIDFMESHSDYSMCFTNAWKYDMALDKKYLINIFPQGGTYSLEEQVKLGLGSAFPATVTYFLRTDLYRNVYRELSLHLKAVGDYPTRVLMAAQGKVYYSEEPTAVYRCGVKGSFSAQVKCNSKYFLDYIFGMTEVYGFLDKFMNYEFHQIYTAKLKSEYLGMASKVDKEELHNYKKSLSEDQIESFDESFYKRCCEIISPDEIGKDLAEFIGKNLGTIYLYGTSPLAEKIYLKLKNNNIEINGFVVSDGFGKPDEFQGKKTMYLSELAQTNERASIILSVQPINEISIIENIKKYSNIDYYSLL